MPGAIDIEPNATNTWAIIKNIHVRKCKFKNIGGNTGVVGLYIPLSQSQLTNYGENIVIEGNSIDGTTDSQSGFFFRQTQQTAIDNTSQGLNIKVINNKAKNLASRPFTTTGIKNITFSKNDFESAANGAIIGYTGATDKCVNVKLKDNTFKKCGTTDGKGLAVFTADRVDILRNIFDDCGSVAGVGIDFHTGTSSNIRIIGCDFISPSNVMTIAIQKESGHTFTSAGNVDQQNNFNGLTNNFVASLKNPTNLYVSNSYDTNKLPDSFGLGTEVSIVNGDANLPSTTKQGTLLTTVPFQNTGYRKFYTQWFYPANNDATQLADMYFRKGNSATNDWSAWKKVTGI